MNYRDNRPENEQIGLNESDRIFIESSWWAHKKNEGEDEYFGNLINYSDLKGKKVLEIGCGL